MYAYQQLLTEWIIANLGGIVLALIIGLLLALIVFISINIRLGKLNRKYQKMMQGAEGQNLEKLLLNHIANVQSATQQVQELTKRCELLEQKNQWHIQKVGLVRFNAFEDTGSDLSFAIALLNEADTGFVLSSIFGREESRVYAKPIEKGQSSYFLTEEEQAALRKARSRQEFRQE